MAAAPLAREPYTSSTCVTINPPCDGNLLRHLAPGHQHDVRLNSAMGVLDPAYPPSLARGRKQPCGGKRQMKHSH